MGVEEELFISHGYSVGAEDRFSEEVMPPVYDLVRCSRATVWRRRPTADARGPGVAQIWRDGRRARGLARELEAVATF